MWNGVVSFFSFFLGIIVMIPLYFAFSRRVNSFSHPGIHGCGTNRCQASFRVVVRSMYRAEDRRNNVDIFYKKPRKKQTQQDFAKIQADVDVAPAAEAPASAAPAAEAPASAAPASAAPASAAFVDVVELADVKPLVSQSVVDRHEKSAAAVPLDTLDRHEAVPLDRPLPAVAPVGVVLEQEQAAHPGGSNADAKAVSTANNIVERAVKPKNKNPRPDRMLSARELLQGASGTSRSKNDANTKESIPTALPKPRRLGQKREEIVSDTSRLPVEDSAKQMKTRVAGASATGASSSSGASSSGTVHESRNQPKSDMFSAINQEQLLEDIARGERLVQPLVGNIPPYAHSGAIILPEHRRALAAVKNRLQRDRERWIEQKIRERQIEDAMVEKIRERQVEEAIANELASIDGDLTAMERTVRGEGRVANRRAVQAPAARGRGRHIPNRRQNRTAAAAAETRVQENANQDQPQDLAHTRPVMHQSQDPSPNLTNRGGFYEPYPHGAQLVVLGALLLFGVSRAILKDWRRRVVPKWK